MFCIEVYKYKITSVIVSDLCKYSCCVFLYNRVEAYVLSLMSLVSNHEIAYPCGIRATRSEVRMRLNCYVKLRLIKVFPY